MRDEHGLGLAASDFDPVPPEIAERVQRALHAECRFEYDLAQSSLSWTELRFYPPGTWLCQLESQPRPRRLRVGWRKPKLPPRMTHYFIYRPSDESLPIMPLGDDTDWVLRANKYYGLTLGTREAREHEFSPSNMFGEEEPAVLHKIIQYLHFYFSFTRYGGYIGGPMRFRVPRTIADLEFSGAAHDDRSQALGALWRFLDARGTGQVQPAIGTVTYLIKRCHADVPIQIGSQLWRLRVSLRLRSGAVRLYGQVPFFHSPNLVAPPTTGAKTLPTPRRLFYREPWLLVPERARSAIGALVYFALAVSWLAATIAAMGVALTFIFHPRIVAQLRDFLASLLPLGWGAVWLCAAYAIVVFGLVVAFVFQFDGVLKRAARTAPGPLRAAYNGMEKLQRGVWDWFRPNLQSPIRKTGTAALWLLVSSIFLVLSFTTLQVASNPATYADDVAGQGVLRTFFGHATIAFPGLPYVLGAFDLDPLEWLKEPSMKSAMVLGFRAMMLLVVYRAFWKLLGYASPRILARDSRRLEHEIAKLRNPRRRRAATDGPTDRPASAAAP